mgnify:CR=1 FL=1
MNMNLNNSSRKNHPCACGWIAKTSTGLTAHKKKNWCGYGAKDKRSYLKRSDYGKRLIRIKEMLADNPFLSLQELGDEFGISRERIRQILKKEGIKKEIAHSYLRPTYCAEGHQLTHRRGTGKVNRARRCFICKPLPRTQHLDEYGRIRACRISKPCTYCGETITRPAGLAERSSLDPRYKGNWYCSKQCFTKNQNKKKWWLSSPIIQRFKRRERLMHKLQSGGSRQSYTYESYSEFGGEE